MAETKTFTEMRDIARRLHPGATVALNFEGRWEITVPTEFEETYALGAEFDGTAAAEAHASYESGETVLERWARKNDHGSDPLELAARWFNLDHSRRVDSIVKFDEALTARGLPTVMRTNFEALSAQEYADFKALRQQVLAQLEPGWQAEETALRELQYGAE